MCRRDLPAIFDNCYGAHVCQDCQPSHLKHSRMANTLVRQDKVQSRSEVMRHPSTCPIMNKDEHVDMPQRKVQQPQLNGLSQLEFNHPGLDYIHQWQVPGFLFCSEVWLNNFRPVSQLPFINSIDDVRINYFCHQCVVK